MEMSGTIRNRKPPSAGAVNDTVSRLFEGLSEEVNPYTYASP